MAFFDTQVSQFAEEWLVKGYFLVKTLGIFEGDWKCRKVSLRQRAERDSESHQHECETHWTLLLDTEM